MAEQTKPRIDMAQRSGFLLRWAMIESALPKQYTILVLDILRQKGVLTITKRQVNDCRNDGITNWVVLEAFEQLAKSYFPEKIRSEDEAREFLAKWERRPGYKSQAALAAVV